MNSNLPKDTDIELTQLIFMSLPIGLAVIDSDTGEICFANDAYCDMLGRERDAVQGRTWMEFTHPDDVEDDRSTIRRHLESGTSRFVKEKRYVKPDNTVCVASVTGNRVSDYNRRRLHVIMVENISKRRQERKKIMLDKQEIQEALFPSLAILSEFRDRETGEHLLRTRMYVKLLLENYDGGKVFSRKAVTLISNSAMLHDIGKIGIPDSILLKPDKLTDDEFSIIKRHTIQGGKALRQIQNYLGSASTFSFALEISERHHERWDGTGYPSGLTGSEIPLTARVMAIADVYDALRSDRPYKKAYTHREAMEIIRQGAGTHFDPELVDVFLSIEKEFEKTAAMSDETLRKMEKNETD